MMKQGQDQVSECGLSSNFYGLNGGGNLQIKDKPTAEVNKPAESEPLIWPELTPVLIRILNRMWFKFWQASSKLVKGRKLSVYFFFP